MNTSFRPDRALFALAMLGLGITGLANGDFALVWQDVPWQHFPGRTLLADLCAVIEIAGGLGLLVGPTRKWASRLLFPYMALWVVLLCIPKPLQAPGVINSWGSVGEISIITAGAWVLFATHAGVREQGWARFLAGDRGIRAARWLLIASLPMIGLVVLIQGATYTLPPQLTWLPRPVDWVYLSGIGSIAACLGLLFGVWPRLAATMEAAMLGVITVWFWGPFLHTGRTATTAFLISTLIAGGVWLVAGTYRGVGWLATTGPAWTGQRERRRIADETA